MMCVPSNYTENEKRAMRCEFHIRALQPVAEALRITGGSGESQVREAIQYFDYLQQEARQDDKREKARREGVCEVCNGTGIERYLEGSVPFLCRKGCPALNENLNVR